MTALVAAGIAAAAAHLLLGGAGRRSWRSRPPAAQAVLASIVIVVGGGSVAALLDGTRVVVAFVALAVVAASAQELGRRRRLVAAEQRSERVLTACEGLASDLRAGQPPASALAAAAEDWPELAPAAAAAGLGADVPAALRGLASQPGAGQVRVVAAAWQVAHRTGAGLAAALELAATQLREDRATGRVVATEMAAAQSTARLLAVLPLGVLLLGGGLGGDPVGFLLDTPPGLVCLCVGLALEYLGLRWLARIGDRVLGRR
jgi:tight adherence protein B